MTYFAVLYTYNPDSEKVAEVRTVHREFIANLHAEGKIVGSGPFVDGDGGALIVIKLEEGSNLVDAETLMNNDPFHVENVLDNRVIRSWTPVTKDF